MFLMICWKHIFSWWQLFVFSWEWVFAAFQLSSMLRNSMSRRWMTKDKRSSELSNFLYSYFAQAYEGMGDNYKVVSLNDASFRWDPRRCLHCKQCLTSKIPFIRDPVLQGVSSLQAVFDVKINWKPPFRDPVLQGVTINVKKGELIGVVGKVLCLHFQKWHRYEKSTFLVQNSKSEFLSLGF